MSYRIVSDSACSLFSLEGADFKSVPLKIVAGDKEYIDAPGVNTDQMVKELLVTKEKTHTSCPNVYDWLTAFEGADRILAITITSKLSGSNSAAVRAAKEYEESHPGAKVHVIDSLSAGPEMILLIEKLRDFISQNLSFEEITRKIHDYMDHTHLLFSLESLANLARNGRVNPAVAKIAGVLGIRMVGKAKDGTLAPLHKCRGEKKALCCIFDEMQAHGYLGGRARIIHCMNEAAAAFLSDLLKSHFPRADVSITPCTALCAYYAEKGGLLIGYEDGSLMA